MVMAATALIGGQTVPCGQVGRGRGSGLQGIATLAAAAGRDHLEADRKALVASFIRRWRYPWI